MDQKYVVYNALLSETVDLLIKNQRTNFVVLVQSAQVWPLTRFQFPLHVTADKETPLKCHLRVNISGVTKCVTKFLSLSKWGVFDSIEIWNLKQDGTQEKRHIVWHIYQKCAGKTIVFPALQGLLFLLHSVSSRYHSLNG